MSKYTTRIPTNGPHGNIFSIVSTAARLLQELEPTKVVVSMQQRALNAKSYKDACDVVREFFPLGDEP